MLSIKITPSRSNIHVSVIDGDRELTSLVSTISIEQLRQIGIEMVQVLNRGWQREGGNDQDQKDLIELSDDLGSMILRPELLSRLRAGSYMSINVPTAWMFIPWELASVHGTAPMLNMAVGRTFSDLSAMPSQQIETTPSLSIDKFRIWANPTFDLRHAEIEANYVCKILKEELGISVQPSRRNLSRKQLLQMIDGLTSFHFAGHSSMSSGQRCWQLVDGALTAREIQESPIVPPRFMFVNACGSAWLDPQSPEESLIAAFVNKGAKNYLGLWTPILDHHALQFTNAMYGELALGGSIGHAMLKSREYLRRHHGWRNLLVGNYVLYGNPTVCPLANQADVTSEYLTPKKKEEELVNPLALRFPVNCKLCNRELKSHFLVCSRDDSGAVVCRYCLPEVLATEKPRKIAPESPKLLADSADQPTVNPERINAGQPARREIEQAADLKTSVLSLPPSWQRLISSVADKQKIKNPATGLVHDATWIGNLTRHGHHTYVLKVDGTGERLPLPNWRLEIKYVEMQDLQKGNPISTWLTSQSRLGDSLESIQFLVLVSQTAWSTDTIKQLESVIQNRPSLKIVLINLEAKQPTIPFENAYCCELTKWLNWRVKVTEFCESSGIYRSCVPWKQVYRRRK